MSENKKSWTLTHVPNTLQIASGEEMLQEIRRLREAEFTKHYPGPINFYEDVFDDYACVLSSANDDGEIVSTGRIVFDDEPGLPADELINSEVNKLRDQGYKVAELSKFAISSEARGLLRTYMRTYYEISRDEEIDFLVFIVREKSAGFYEKTVGARILAVDIGYSYGTDETFYLMAWDIKASREYLSRWLKEEIA